MSDAEHPRSLQDTRFDFESCQRIFKDSTAPAADKSFTVTYAGKTHRFDDNLSLEACIKTVINNIVNGRCRVDDLRHCAVITSASLLLLETEPDQEAQPVAALFPPQPAESRSSPASDIELRDREDLEADDDTLRPTLPLYISVSPSSSENDDDDNDERSQDEVDTAMPDADDATLGLGMIENQGPDQSQDSISYGIMDRLYNDDSLPPGSVSNVAAFFQVSEQHIIGGQPIRIRGTKIKLKTYQAAALYRIIRQSQKHPDLTGHYLADSMGFGKTFPQTTNLSLPPNTLFLTTYITAYAFPRMGINTIRPCLTSFFQGQLPACAPFRTLLPTAEPTGRWLGTAFPPNSCTSDCDTTALQPCPTN